MNSAVLGREGLLVKYYFEFTLLAFLLSFFVLPTNKMVNNVFYIFALLPVSIAVVLGKAKFLQARGVFFAAIVFLALNVISAVYTGAEGQFYKHVAYVLVFFVLTVYLVRIDFFLNKNFKLYAFWLVSIYVLGSAVFYWLIGRYAFGERVLWLPSRMTGPIYTSILISSVFLMVLPQLLDEKKYIQLGLGLAVSLFNIIFVVQSRSGLAAMIAVLFLYTVFRAIVKKDFRPIFVVLGVIVFFIGFFQLLSEFANAATSIFSRADAGRFALWAQLLVDFKQCNLFLGCGPGVQSGSTFGAGHPILHPHSVFFSLVWYTGLLSLLGFLVLLAIAIYFGIKTQESWVLYLMSSIVGLCFDGSNVVGNPDEVWLLLLLPMFIIFAKQRIAKQSLSDGKSVVV